MTFCDAITERIKSQVLLFQFSVIALFMRVYVRLAEFFSIHRERKRGLTFSGNLFPKTRLFSTYLQRKAVI